MSHANATGFCDACNAQRRLIRPRPNHILHLLLTIITAGLWIIVWILCAIRIGGWRCQVCGRKTARKLLA